MKWPITVYARRARKAKVRAEIERLTKKLAELSLKNAKLSDENQNLSALAEILTQGSTEDGPVLRVCIGCHGRVPHLSQEQLCDPCQASYAAMRDAHHMSVYEWKLWLSQ